MKLQAFTDIELLQLDRIKARLTGPKDDILEAIGVYMVSSVMLNFEAEGRPDSWVENAGSTLKQKKGNMVLADMGLLKAGIMYWIEGGAVYIGPSGPASVYSRIQQKGGQAGPGLAVEIPARPYLVVQDEDQTWIVGLIRKEVLGA